MYPPGFERAQRKWEESQPASVDADDNPLEKEIANRADLMRVSELLKLSGISEEAADEIRELLKPLAEAVLKQDVDDLKWDRENHDY